MANNRTDKEVGRYRRRYHASGECGGSHEYAGIAAQGITAHQQHRGDRQAHGDGHRHHTGPIVPDQHALPQPAITDSGAPGGDDQERSPAQLCDLRRHSDDPQQDQVKEGGQPDQQMNGGQATH